MKKAIFVTLIISGSLLPFLGKKETNNLVPPQLEEKDAQAASPEEIAMLKSTYLSDDKKSFPVIDTSSIESTEKQIQLKISEHTQLVNLNDKLLSEAKEIFAQQEQFRLQGVIAK